MSIETAPAWQVREVERQKRLEEIMQEIIAGEAKANDDGWYFGRWCQVLYFELAGDERAVEKLLAKYPELAHILPRVVFLIEKFGRSAKEEEALMAKLLEWVLQVHTSGYHAALRDEEFTDPKLIYGTDRATDEVPIPD